MVRRSDTSIAHEVFSALWALTFLGAAGCADHIDDGFARLLPCFFERHEDRLDRVIALAQSSCRLSAETRSIFEDWRRNAAVTLASQDDTAMWLSVYSGLLVPPAFDLSDGDLVARVIGFGIDCQTVNFIDAMVLGVTERRPAEHDGFEDLVSAVGQVVEIADPQAAYGVSGRGGYRTWRVAKLGALLDPNSGATDEARDELRSAVSTLDKLFELC
jgi:hypothetical protein